MLEDSARFGELGAVVWFSSKVTDGAPLTGLCHVAAACSLLGAPALLGPQVGGYCHEQATGRRLDYDLESFDELDRPGRAAITGLVAGLARSGPVTLVPFFAYRLTSALARTVPAVRLLGNPPELERRLDHKPWVDGELDRLGVPRVRWYPVAADAVPGLPFPLVARPPRGTGGTGMTLVHDPAELRALLDGAQDAATDAAAAEAPDPDGGLCVSQFLPNAVSVNASACVNADGTVSPQPLSLQIIGAPECSPRLFGYCGNDFGRAPGVLADGEVAQIAAILDRVGRWLHGLGFRGVFGVDVLVREGRVLVCELNPRFQGSSHLGALLMREAGAPDAYYSHLTAHLGRRPAGERPGLAEIVAAQRPLAQIFCYGGRPEPAAPPEQVPAAAGIRSGQVEFLPQPGTVLAPHALRFRRVVDECVLDESGRRLLPTAAAEITALRTASTAAASAASAAASAASAAPEHPSHPVRQPMTAGAGRA